MKCSDLADRFADRVSVAEIFGTLSAILNANITDKPSGLRVQKFGVGGFLQEPLRPLSKAMTVIDARSSIRIR
jgi:hypothetical protein